MVHEDQDEKIVCRVNDCDATSQVKAKILDAVYKNTPFSLRPSINDVDLGMKEIFFVVVVIIIMIHPLHIFPFVLLLLVIYCFIFYFLIILYSRGFTIIVPHTRLVH